MTRIKLCGLTRLKDIEAANALMPDYIGFVFAEKSRRFVPPEIAAVLRERLNPGIMAAGVFVDAPREQVAELLNRDTIQIAQLHGHEDEAYIRALRGLTDRTIWKAFKITAPTDLKAADVSSADLVLLDNGPGGTGEAFDWALLREFHARPYVLAGGLNPENAAEAIAALRPFGLDVSSGIETEGRKDPGKMEKFVRAVREADSQEATR
ncbi:MAG: phosphoribosylanthranilate isomerase [Oscillospiraceae bacterium]|nr:phosphoribosylanthranilate isomerase [Oscillospiraceae bacterium]